MRKSMSMWRGACGLLVAAAGGLAVAQALPPAAPVPPVPGPASVHPDTREYVWTFEEPVLTTEHVDVVTTVLAPKVHGRRWDFEWPTLNSRHVWLGQVAEFGCRYADWQLPDVCRTEWHDVYADLPVLAMQRDHVDYDAVEWAWEERTVRIDVPRWSWRTRTLSISVPVLVTDSERAQAGLAAQQAAAASAVDEGIATLDQSMAQIRAQGADPRRLATSGGASLDLAAMREALRDEAAVRRERLVAIRDELKGIAPSSPPPAATP